MASCDACYAMNGFREVIPRDNSLVAEVIDASHNTFIDGGKDGYCQITSISRSADLVKDSSQFRLFVSQAHHGLHKVIAKGGVEPCCSDNEEVLAVCLHAFFSCQLGTSIHRVGTCGQIFGHRSVAGAVKHIVCADLNHASSPFAHSLGQIARGDIVEQIAEVFVALCLIHCGEGSAVHHTVYLVLFHKSLHLCLVGDIQ